MILRDIALSRRRRVEREKAARPLEEIKRSLPQQPGRDFKKALQSPHAVSIIAEIKKASPSKGILSSAFDPAKLARSYQEGGAQALSVVTEEDFFQGCDDFLKQSKKASTLPLLRKDFIIDPYQIYQSKLLGADAVLLIAALLSERELFEFHTLVHDLKMQALVEVHTPLEMKSAQTIGASLMGMNNRDLKTFQTDLETTAQLARLAPEKALLVSESGIHSRSDMLFLEKHSVRAALIGEALVRSACPVRTIHQLRGEDHDPS